MIIIREIIDSLEKGVPVRDIIRGPLWTGVVSNGCGLASTLHEGECSSAEGKGVKDPAGFAGKTADDLAELSFSREIPEASLGLAAINSLIEPVQDESDEMNAAEFLIKAGKGKNVSIIGHFPFVDQVREAAENLWVIEKRPQPGDYREEESGKFLPLSDIIAISSTTLINHTLEPLLELCPDSSITMLLGPTTPLSEILFDHGVDIISGSRVTDIPVVCESIARGISFSRMKRIGGIRLVNLIRDKSLFNRIMGS